MARWLMVVLTLLLGSGAWAADEMRAEDHELNPVSPTDLMGKDMTLTTADGTAFDVYASGPEDAKRGVVLLHEWWGLNDHIRAWAA